MDVTIIANINKDDLAAKMTGVGRYSHYLVNQISASLYSTQKNNKLLNIFQKITGKDLNTFFATMPFYYPFKEFKKDNIVHLTTQTLAFPLVWQKPKNKVIVTVHDIIPFVSNNYHSIWEKIVYKIIMYGVKNADHLIVDSEHTKKDIITFLNIPELKITVVYLGIDLNKFNPDKRITKQNNTILYVGSEEKTKNLRTLFKAFADVKKQIHDARLIKVGLPMNTEVHKRLKSLAKDLQIENDIVWKGYVENLSDEYRRATVFVHPSFYEGFGFPVLEAMACGCPVICSDKTSLPELARNAAIYFDGYDHRDLAKHIIYVLRNKNIQDKLIKKGLRNVHDFTWEKCIEKTKEVYEIYSQC